jgi:hypothetical protein
MIVVLFLLVLGSNPARPEIVVGDSATSAAIIWVHGLGDSGKGWRSFAEHITKKLPHVRATYFVAIGYLTFFMPLLCRLSLYCPLPLIGQFQ